MPRPIKGTRGAAQARARALLLERPDLDGGAIAEMSNCSRTVVCIARRKLVKEKLVAPSQRGRRYGTTNSSQGIQEPT